MERVQSLFIFSHPFPDLCGKEVTGNYSFAHYSLFVSIHDDHPSIYPPSILLTSLPLFQQSFFQSIETNTNTCFQQVHFAVQSLEMIGFFDDETNLARYNVNKQHIIDWVYQLQIMGQDGPSGIGTGFQGGTFLGNPSTSNQTISDADTDTDADTDMDTSHTYYNQGHIAMTYSAISTLITLGDDCSRLDQEGVVKGLASLQREDGR
jgi:hypothetical protein